MFLLATLQTSNKQKESSWIMVPTNWDLSRVLRSDHFYLEGSRGEIPRNQQVHPLQAIAFLSGGFVSRISLVGGLIGLDSSGPTPCAPHTHSKPFVVSSPHHASSSQNEWMKRNSNNNNDGHCAYHDQLSGRHCAKHPTTWNFSSSQQLCDMAAISIPILQIRKLRFQDVEWFNQLHDQYTLKGGTPPSGNLTPRPQLLAPSHKMLFISKQISGGWRSEVRMSGWQHGHVLLRILFLACGLPSCSALLLQRDWATGGSSTSFKGANTITWI